MVSADLIANLARPLAFEELIRRYGITFRTAVDLGCGAGLFARRALRIPRRVDLVTCNYETLSRLIDCGDLRTTFRNIADHLHPKGHFVFDIVMQSQSPGSAKSHIQHFISTRRKVTQRVRWEPRRKLLSIAVSVRSARRPQTIFKVQRERIYSAAEIGRALLDAGFVIRGVHDAETLDWAQESSPRIVIVASKKNC